MRVHGGASARMVAWESLFLLQHRETNEVLLRGSRLQENLQASGTLPEADDVVQR
jgi:hypothetical protein